MRNTSGYIWKIISLLFLLSGNIFSAVSEEKNETKKTFYGVFVNFDIADPIMSAFSSSRFGMNASIEADLFHTFFPVFEIGYGEYDASSDYSYITNQSNNKYKVYGTYYKIGINVNLLKKNYSDKISPLAYLGIRYAISPFKYTIENYTIENLYWGNQYPGGFSNKGNTIGQWAEFTAGARTPVYKNFCLGVEIRFKQFLYIKEKKSENQIIHQSYAPGFGNEDDGKWGFRYTISYFFHL